MRKEPQKTNDSSNILRASFGGSDDVCIQGVETLALKTEAAVARCSTK